jgi:hypothetical protein
MNSLKMLYVSGRSFALTMVFLLGALLVPFYMASAQDEEEVADKNVLEQRLGTVDRVGEESLVIDDSTVFLNGSVKLYDQYGNNANKGHFQEGDLVTLALAEDEKAGKKWVVSVTLVQKGGGKKQTASSGQEESKQPQVIQEVNGVWTN